MKRLSDPWQVRVPLRIRGIAISGFVGSGPAYGEDIRLRCAPSQSRPYVRWRRGTATCSIPTSAATPTSSWRMKAP